MRHLTIGNAGSTDLCVALGIQRNRQYRRSHGMKSALLLRCAQASLLFGLLISSAPMASQTRTFTAVADTFVNQVQPDDVKGSLYQLQVGRYYQDSPYLFAEAGIRFSDSDLALLPSDTSQIQNATLRLFCYQGQRLNMWVWIAWPSWSESTMTWNNKGNFCGIDEYTTIDLPAGNPNIWVEIDVTQHVKRWRNGSRENYGFYLGAANTPNSGQYSSFGSRETGTYAPQLVVTTSGGVVPDSCEPDDSVGMAKTIVSDQTQNRTIHEAGNVDWVKFTVGAIGASNVKIETDGANGDTQMWLYGPNNSTSQVDYNDDGGNGAFSLITQSSLAAGTYYIKITEYDNGGTIPAYTLFAHWDEIALPTLSVTANDNYGSEANDGSDTIAFRFERQGGNTAQALSFYYRLGGTASQTADYAYSVYSPPDGEGWRASLISVGQTYWDLTLRPVDDNLVEGDETVTVELKPSSNYTIGTGSAQATIGDNDSPTTYPVSYDANGATSGTAPASQTKTHDVPLTLWTNTGNLAKTGYTLAGWNTNSSGTGTDYSLGGTYTANASVTLYAKWTSLPTYPVSYNANGATSGTAPASQTKTHDVALTLQANTGNLAKTSYTLVGWNTNSSGTGTDYALGGTYTANSSVTLYAKWSALPTYAVSYNANGATSGTAPASQTKTHDVALTLQTNTGNLAKTGYTLAGWNTNSSGTGTPYALGGTYTTNASVTLYATWAPQGSVAATHSAPGYRPAVALTVTNTFTYTGTLLSLLWRPVLPAGWSVANVSGDGTVEVQAGEIVWTGTLPASPVQMSYTVNVPAQAAGQQQVRGAVEYQLSSGGPNPVTLYASSDPLLVLQASYHSADYRDARWVIDGTEVNRVLAYWRSGALHVDSVGLDGYAAGNGNTSGSYHSADYRDTRWVIDGTEVNRVLAYWRSGAYHVDSAGLDGYAAGSGRSLRSGDRGVVSIVQTVPVSYVPGTSVTVTNTFAYSGTLLSLLWRPILPAGWTLAPSPTGNGTVELQGGEILWTGTLPASPITLTYTVNVPLDASGPKQIRGQVEYQFEGDGPNPVTAFSTPDPATLSPNLPAIPTITAQSPANFYLGTQNQASIGNSLVADGANSFTGSLDITASAGQTLIGTGFAIATAVWDGGSNSWKPDTGDMANWPTYQAGQTPAGYVAFGTGSPAWINGHRFTYTVNGNTRTVVWRPPAGFLPPFEGSRVHLLSIGGVQSNNGQNGQNWAIRLDPPNRTPVITNTTGMKSYHENGGPVLLAPVATVTDADQPANLNGGALYVDILVNGDPTNDVLSILSQGTGADQIGVNGTSVTYGGTTIGTVVATRGVASLKVNLNTNATLEAVQALVRCIQFQSGTDAPTAVTRTVRFFLDDGAAPAVNLYKVSVFQGRFVDARMPAPSPVYNFEFDAETSAYVKSVRVVCPGGADITLTQARQADKSYRYDATSQKAEWEYDPDFANATALNQFGDGAYTVTLTYFNGATQTETFYFNKTGAAGGAAIPSMTVEPVLTGSSPFVNGVATLNAAGNFTYSWNPASKDPLADLVFLWQDVQDEEVIDEQFPIANDPGTKTVTLPTGIGEIGFGFAAGLLNGHNANGILFDVGRFSEKRYGTVVGTHTISGTITGDGTTDGGKLDVGLLVKNGTNWDYRDVSLVFPGVGPWPYSIPVENGTYSLEVRIDTNGNSQVNLGELYAQYNNNAWPPEEIVINNNSATANLTTAPATFDNDLTWPLLAGVGVSVTPVNDPPVCTVNPAVTGTWAYGGTLTASPGTWNDTLDGNLPSTIGFTYQWQRADDVNGTNATPILNATNRTYTLTNADADKFVGVRVTATDSGTPAPGVTNAAASIWQAVGKIPLTLTGLIANNKTYDGGIAATISSYGTLTGIVGTDIVTLDTAGATAVFADKNTGNGKSVTVSGLALGGANAGNYSIANQTTTANITPKQLTITGLTANNKVYDGTTTAVLSGTPVLNGLANGEGVILGGAATASFDTKNVGASKPVTVAGYAISGASAGNYALSQPTGLAANITPAPLTVTANNQSRNFGAANPALTWTATGFAAGDTKDNSLTGTPDLSTPAVPNSPSTSTYPINITQGTLGATNYALDLRPGTLTVTNTRPTAIGNTANTPQIVVSLVADGYVTHFTLTGTDPESNPLAFAQVGVLVREGGTVTTETLTVNANGSCSFNAGSVKGGAEPGIGYHFQFKVNDGEFDSSVVTYYLKLINNQPPEVRAASATVRNADNSVSGAPNTTTTDDTALTIDEGQKVDFNITFNDRNADGSAHAPQDDGIAGIAWNKTVDHGQPQALTGTAPVENPAVTNSRQSTFASLTTDFFTANAASPETTIVVTATATDGNGVTRTKSWTITVRDVNQPPTFTKGGNVTVAEDSGAYTNGAGWATNISAGAEDTTGQTVAFTATPDKPYLFAAGPVIAANGTLTFTPAANANGTATVTVTLGDGTIGANNSSAAQTFTIAITPVNDAPTFTLPVNPPPAVNEDAPAQTVADFATGISKGQPANANFQDDESGQTLQFVITANTKPALFAAGPAIDPASGRLTYTPAANASGTANVTVELRDSGGIPPSGWNSGTFTITVNPVNDAPTADNKQHNWSGIGTTEITITGSDVDYPFGPAETSTFAITTAPANGTLTEVPNSQSRNGNVVSKRYTYAPTGGTQLVRDTFAFTVTDAANLVSNTATVDISVGPPWYPFCAWNSATQDGWFEIEIYKTGVLEPVLGPYSIQAVNGLVKMTPREYIRAGCTGLLPGNYTYRYRAFDVSTGQFGAWTDPMIAFAPVQYNVPGAPTTADVAPNPDVLVANQPPPEITFTIVAPDAQGYELTVAGPSGYRQVFTEYFSPNADGNLILNEQVTRKLVLTTPGTYTWGVRGFNPHDSPRAYSPVKQGNNLIVQGSQILPQPPTPPPILKTPAANAVLTAGTGGTVFQWEPATNADGYVLNVTNVRTGMMPYAYEDVGNVTRVSDMALPPGSYVWNVIAYNLGFSQFTWSEPAGYFSVVQSLTLPTVVSAAQNGNNGLTIGWQGAAPTKVNVQLYFIGAPGWITLNTLTVTPTGTGTGTVSLGAQNLATGFNFLYVQGVLGNGQAGEQSRLFSFEKAP